MAVSISLAGKNAIITGAGSGMGRCTALMLAEAGANILVAGSSLFKTKRPRSVMAAMREAGREHPFIG